MNYDDLPTLALVYLEDSFVLEILEEPATLRFRLDAVLTPTHPRYQPPAAGEQHCYAGAWLTFDQVRERQWLQRSTLIFTDANGEQDLGNIDQMTRDGDWWDLGGDWGRLRVRTASTPVLTLAGPM